MPKKSKIISILVFYLLFSAFSVCHAGTVDYRLLKPEYFAKLKNGQEFSDEIEAKQQLFRVVNTKTMKGVQIKINGSWKQHGIFYYYSAGKLKRLAIYDKGKKNGVETKYRTGDGSKISDTEWANGLTHGEVTEYQKNSLVSKKCNWQNGDKHGICRWYHKNGNLSTERTYVKNKQHGIMKHYKNNGKLSYTEMFENDQKVGTTNWAK